MKVIRVVLIIFAFFQVNSIEVAGQWVQKGPSGEEVRSLSLFGKEILTRTDRYVIRSTDNGETWERFGWPAGVHRLAVAGTTVFLSTEDSLLSSVDNGATWTYNAHYFTGGISFLESNGTDVYVGNTGSGIFRSTDYGFSWSVLPRWLWDRELYCLFAYGTRVFAGSGSGGVLIFNRQASCLSKVSRGVIEVISNWLISGRPSRIQPRLPSAEMS